MSTKTAVISADDAKFIARLQQLIEEAKQKALKEEKESAEKLYGEIVKDWKDKMIDHATRGINKVDLRVYNDLEREIVDKYKILDRVKETVRPFQCQVNRRWELLIPVKEE